MQFRPRFTGASGSPLTATILPSLVAIIIPQPVPQNLHAALSQRQPFSAAFCAAAIELGSAIPALAQAAEAAALFIKSRRSIFSPRLFFKIVLKNQTDINRYNLNLS